MRALTLAAILLLPGCVTAGLPSCPGNARAQLRAELIFGRGLKSGGEVGEAAWRRFLDREVTPRFQTASLSSTRAANGAARAP